MEEETQTKQNSRFKTFGDVYEMDDDLSLDFEEDYDLPILPFCDI